jgi:hypothetical protein
MTTTDERLLRLVQRLAALTEAGTIAWEENRHSYGSFEASLPEFSVRVSPGGGLFLHQLELFDGGGNPIVCFPASGARMDAFTMPLSDALSTLCETIRRRTEGVDSALDRILGSLG